MKGQYQATVLGGTGLVGGFLLDRLQSDARIREIRLLSRRKLTISHPKVQTTVIDFSNEEAFRKALADSELIYCAVGTTRKKAKGNMALYREVDHDIPLNAARFAASSSCRCFAVVSSVGADSGSSNFYLRLKGEVEDKLRRVDIPSILVFRPSMLLGSRNEFRLGEMLGKILMLPFSMILPSKIRPIHARTVADAMVEASLALPAGFHVYHHSDMKRLAEPGQ